MKNPNEDFKAEDAIMNLDIAIESQFNALSEPRFGTLATILETAIHRRDINKATRKLAEALDVKTSGKHPSALITELADKAEAQNIPGAKGLKLTHEWAKAFWSKDDVTQASKKLNPFASVKALKKLAQQYPKLP
jgi:hypothetical protein